MPIPKPSAEQCPETTSITQDKLKRPVIRKALYVLFWLVLWQALSLIVDNNILLAGPYESIKALLVLGGTADFWLSVLYSLLKITLGFLIGLTLGSILAAISYRFKFIREFLSPPVSVIKSIPVASFVILVIIWAGAPSLATVISALVVFPMVYLNVLSGLDTTPGPLIEMAGLFRFRLTDRIRYIYLPAIRSHLLGAVTISSGMAFKSGIAAEVIGRPLHSIGSGLYLSKISLATDDLFAWTFLAVVLSYLFEKVITCIIRRLISE